MNPGGNQARTVIAVFMAGIAAVASFGASIALAADEPAGPTRDTSFRMSKPSPNAAMDTAKAWMRRPAERGAPRGMPPTPAGELVYDNGMPLEDTGQTASQFSLSRDGAQGVWRFVAAVADDFVIEDPIEPFLNVRITTVRAPIFFFNLGSDPNPTPVTTFTQGVYVVFYENSALDIPEGQPDVDPNNPVGPINFLGPPKAVVLVSNDQIVETAVDDACNGRFIIDLPVDVTVQKNRRYWISVVPRYPAQPQCAWNISQDSFGFDAHAGFPVLGQDFWGPIDGNDQNIECPSAPLPQTHRDVSFQLYGEQTLPDEIACCDLLNDTCVDTMSIDECFAINPFTIAFLNATCAEIDCPVVTGACCNDSTGICTNNVELADCVQFGSRFAFDATCAQLDPPCGTTDLGACCTRDAGCQDLTPTECSLIAGEWFAGSCATVSCPSANDDCVDAQIITQDGVYPFSTLNAETDGPLDSPGGICTNVLQDVWFRYVATCDGMVTAATCSGTNFDSAINVYRGCFCDGNMGPMIACANNNCGAMNDDATVTFAATEGQCYLIRVGGAGAAEGTGLLVVGCVPAQQGACCSVLGICELVTEPECMTSGGTFTPGAPCSPITCPMPDNDECVAALQISEGTFLFDNTGASDSMQARPGGACPDIGDDIWFRHTVQCDGTLTVSTCGATNFDSVVAVYEDDCNNGPSCDPLDALLACEDDGCGIAGGPSEVQLAVTAGQCLLIRVGGVGGSTGTGSLLVACVPSGEGACCDALDGCELRLEAACQDTGDVFYPGSVCAAIECETPANDDCASAIDISNGVHEFSTLRGTANGPAIDSSMGACLDVNRDIWFRYTATCDGTLAISPCLDADFDATVAVYDTCICPMDATTQIACTSGTLDAGCGMDDNRNRVDVPIVSGNCYLIRVGGVGDEVGSGRLIVGCIPADGGACCLGPDNCVVANATECSNMDGDFTLGEPCSPLTCPLLENDNCSGALDVSDGVYPFDTTDATTDGPMDSPGGVCTNVQNDIWYRYTSTCSGQLRVSLCGNTTYDAAIAVYDATDCPPTAAAAACDNNGCSPNGPAEVLLEVAMGSEYLIRVGGAAGATGAGELTIECIPGVACCLGDVSMNALVNVEDISPMVAALLNPPDVMDPAFCPADTNEDMTINGADIAEFIDLVLTAAPCGGPVELMGACCFPSGDCAIITQAACIGSGNLYVGNGTDCDPNPCPQPPGPPENDHCADAIALSCNVQVVVDNTAATTTPDEPPFSCKFNGPGSGVGTVWYTFVAEATDALISTCNSSAPVNDTIVAVYEGSCPTSVDNEIACVEDAGGACGRRAQVCVDGLTPGQLYTVQIASFDAASRGQIVVDLMCPCPRGACCYPDSSCSELRENECINSGGTYKGDGVSCASNPCPPPPEIDCCKGDVDRNGVVTTADIAPFVAAVLNPPLLGTPEFCIVDADDNGIVNGADIDAFVPIALGATPCPALTNDDCSGAMMLSCGLRVLVDNTTATTAIDDPAFSCRAGGPGQGAGTVWFAFEATATTARVRTCGSLPPATDTILAVYDAVGCPPAPGDAIGCSEDVGLPCGERLSSVCVTGLTPGETYLIQAASFDNDSRGFISVEVECPCP